MTRHATAPALPLPEPLLVGMGPAHAGARGAIRAPLATRGAEAMQGGGVAVDRREEAARLYREYGPAVYRRCLRLLRDRDVARDATQEVFARLVRDMARFDDRESALAWMYRVATNHCLNVLRDARRHGESPLDPDLDVAYSGEGTPFPERRLAQQILSRFDESTQAVAVGVFVDGMEHEEVAAVLGISRRTVSRKLVRFLDRARKFLDRSET